ncbi:hypothetical protein L7F22_010765 [Adiantum nelumboides]|nr:hypothetical protein [Adiantum nelumboides]
MDPVFMLIVTGYQRGTLNVEGFCAQIVASGWSMQLLSLSPTGSSPLLTSFWNTCSAYTSWALVRDIEVAKRMTKYIELSTIGVSKDSQFRASQILKAIRTFYSHAETGKMGGHNNVRQMGLFDFGYKQMESRWEQIRHAIRDNACFSLETFPSGFCNFFEKTTMPHPAFAWLRCEKEEDCHAAFKAKGILTRSGTHFGSSRKYVRISMVDHDKIFQLFIDRLQQMADACHIQYQQLE